VFRKILIGLAFVFICVRAASAHPAPFSYLDIVFKGGGIEGTLVVHVIDVAHELGVPPEKVMEPGFAEAQQKRIEEILASRLYLQGDRRLSFEWQGIELMREEQAVRLRYRVKDANFGALTNRTMLVHLLIYEIADGRLAMSGNDDLTAREREILGLVAEGLTNARIGRELWVTEQTVKFHLSNIYRKLGVSNRTEASRFAYTHGLLRRGPARPVAAEAELASISELRPVTQAGAA